MRLVGFLAPTRPPHWLRTAIQIIERVWLLWTHSWWGKPHSNRRTEGWSDKSSLHSGQTVGKDQLVVYRLKCFLLSAAFDVLELATMPADLSSLLVTTTCVAEQVCTCPHINTYSQLANFEEKRITSFLSIFRSIFSSSLSVRTPEPPLLLFRYCVNRDPRGRFRSCNLAGRTWLPTAWFPCPPRLH